MYYSSARKFLHRLFLIFCIICSGYTPEIIGAQTTVCSGDSVVLILNGYKQGDISWKQSPNGVTWSSASGTVSNDSLSFTATNTYYYRAIVTDGMCSPFYSDTTLVIVNPTPPIAKAASGITQTFFTANWSAVADATDYFLDVATDAGFTSFIAGGKNIDIGTTDTTYSITGLVCLTPYYYRVRDSVDACTTQSANSNTISVTTDSCPHPVCSGTMTDARDGTIYKIIGIGTQCWMAENLNVGKRIDGIKPQTRFDSVGVNTIEKYCYLDNVNSCTTYGGLYMWDEMMSYGQTVSGNKGPKGICPTDWHIPTNDEWGTLISFLGGYDAAGRKLKDTTKWTFYSDATTGTNSSGFTALPAGIRASDDTSYYRFQRSSTYFWTATEDPANGGTTFAWSRYLHYNYAPVFQLNGIKLSFGFSVRCVKD